MTGYATNKPDGAPPPPDETAPVELPRLVSTAIRTIPFALWAKFNQRREAEQARIGKHITREQILLDLVRQYADGVTWYARQDKP